jgi:thioredoxin reductase (NADPH)
MKEAIQNYIGSLNWGYRVALRDKGVKYLNAYGELIDAHKIKVNKSALNFFTLLD